MIFPNFFSQLVAFDNLIGPVDKKSQQFTLFFRKVDLHRFFYQFILLRVKMKAADPDTSSMIIYSYSSLFLFLEEEFQQQNEYKKQK